MRMKTLKRVCAGPKPCRAARRPRNGRGSLPLGILRYFPRVASQPRPDTRRVATLYRLLAFPGPSTLQYPNYFGGSYDPA